MKNISLLTGGGYKPETVGRVYYGCKSRILRPDPISGEGEIGMYSRNTFMGYLKVKAKTK